MSINFSTVWDTDYWMESNSMFCGFNMPPALVSNKDVENEFSHGLPPYAKRRFYLSDEYPAVPKNWVPSEGRKTSYFVPVQEGQGMWLDFNKNSNHKYDVAIVISVQGVNPITGMPCQDAGLEQYIDTCPKHNIAFGPHRYCEKCGYKWPKQNYISTTGTPDGNLWLDGFRTADGVVRQYILTMDKIKGVAANILKEERVFAVGISFFLSVNPKPVIQQNVFRSRGIANGNGSGIYKCCFTSADSAPVACAAVGAAGASASSEKFSTRIGTKMGSGKCKSIDYKTSSKTGKTGKQVINCTDSLDFDRKLEIITEKHLGNVKSVNVQKVEVGAGANINQKIYDDPEPLEFWRKEPESVILINYALEKDCAKIIRQGRISLDGHKESFLKEIPVGVEK